MVAPAAPRTFRKSRRLTPGDPVSLLMWRLSSGGLVVAVGAVVARAATLGSGRGAIGRCGRVTRQAHAGRSERRGVGGEAGVAARRAVRHATGVAGRRYVVVARGLLSFLGIVAVDVAVHAPAHV